jgi:hypothetical protein
MSKEALPPIPKEVLAKMDPEVLNTALASGAFLQEMIGRDAAIGILTDILAVVATPSAGVARRLYNTPDKCLLVLASGIDASAEAIAAALRELDEQIQRDKHKGDFN